MIGEHQHPICRDPHRPEPGPNHEDDVRPLPLSADQYRAVLWQNLRGMTSFFQHLPDEELGELPRGKIPLLCSELRALYHRLKAVERM